MSLAAVILATAVAAAPVRAGSADYCADQYVLALADRDSIVFLSPEATGAYSHLRALARGLPKARAGLEEAAARRPTVILRSYGGDAGAYARAGIAVVTLDDAADFSGVRANIRRAATALGARARGEALIAAMDARLAALAAKGDTTVSALYVTPGGVTAGRGTMIDAIFSAAGVRNAASEAGLSYWPSLPLEALVRSPPTFAVAGFFDAALAGADNWSAARHPVFRKVFSDAPTVFLPADLIACPAWFAVDAAEIVRDGAGRRP